MLAVVLAAGRGTRLGSLTGSRSKAMMPIAGRPMIERVLDMLSRGGAQTFVVVAYPEDQALIEHLSRPPWAERVHLAYQKQRLGMAHAVDCASPLIRKTKKRAFVLAACDNLYPDGHVAALIARRQEDSLDAALTLRWVAREEASTTAVVLVGNGRVERIIEKPGPEELRPFEQGDQALSAPSLYALSTRILDYLPRVDTSPRGEREFPSALQLLIEHGGRVAGQLVDDRMTLTGPGDLLAVNRHVLRSTPYETLIQTDLPEDVRIVKPVRIDAGARVASRCEIGPEVYLERGCSLGVGAIVRRSVVLRGGRVEDGQLIERAVIAQALTKK
jgi:NDP-sugar pyrophosphorylase family protein